MFMIMIITMIIIINIIINIVYTESDPNCPSYFVSADAPDLAIHLFFCNGIGIIIVVLI